MKDIFIGSKETVLYPTSSCFRVILQKGAYEIKAHWHPGIEIIMPLSGNYRAFLGEEQIQLEKGDVLFLHSATIHALSGPSEGVRLIFQFDTELLYSLKEFQSLLFSFPSFLFLQRSGGTSIYPYVQRILLKIIQEYRHQNLLWEARLYSLVLELYTLLFRSPLLQLQALGNTSAASSLLQNRRSQEKFLSVCQYINQNLTSDIDLETAACQAGFSKFYFSRLFRDFVGMSFSQYVTKQRIHKAKLLLLTTDASVTDIALESGFNSSSTFNRCFYSETHMSPTVFRQKHARLRD